MKEIFNEIIALLGGVTVVLTALFAFIGKLWLSRIIERDKVELIGKLESLRTDLNATTKKLEAELQRSIYVDKLQFDNEFSIYKEVWAALVELRRATCN